MEQINQYMCKPLFSMHNCNNIREEIQSDLHAQYVLNHSFVNIILLS